MSYEVYCHGALAVIPSLLGLTWDYPQHISGVSLWQCDQEGNLLLPGTIFQTTHGGRAKDAALTAAEQLILIMNYHPRHAFEGTIDFYGENLIGPPEEGETDPDRYQLTVNGQSMIVNQLQWVLLKYVFASNPRLARLPGGVLYTEGKS